VEWNYLLLFFFLWKLRISQNILQPRTLCAPKPGLRNVTVARIHSIYCIPSENIFAPDLRSVFWFSQAALLEERADPGSEVHTTQPARPNSCVVLEPDSIPSRTFIQYMTVVWELQKCTNTPTCAQARTLERHLSSSLFSTTFYCSGMLECVCTVMYYHWTEAKCAYGRAWYCTSEDTEGSSVCVINCVSVLVVWIGRVAEASCHLCVFFWFTEKERDWDLRQAGVQEQNFR